MRDEGTSPGGKKQGGGKKRKRGAEVNFLGA